MTKMTEEAMLKAVNRMEEMYVIEDERMRVFEDGDSVSSAAGQRQFGRLEMLRDVVRILHEELQESQHG